MTEINQINQIEMQIMDIVLKHIPFEWISSTRISGANFHVQLSELNSSYQNSEYSYSGTRKFVHWTSIQNLMSIINNREFRLYNLQKSSDEKEFKYAAKELSLPENKIDYSKNFLYTLSFCNIQERDNQKLWTEYGKDYSGVAIEFEIKNDPIKWNNIMLSNCYYKIPEKFVQLFAELKKTKNLIGIETNIDFGRLIAFHKHPKFEN